MPARDPLLDVVFAQRLAVTRIAALAGVSRAAVSQWRRIPERHVWAVARVSGLPAHKLRPDLPYYRCGGAPCP